MPMLNDFTSLLLIATAFSVLLMLVTWVVAWRINNLGLVDMAWSLGFLPVAVFFAVAGPGDPERRALMAFMAGLWSLRLGLHVAVRVGRAHPEEDVRYRKLRAEWGARLKSKTFWFFEFQGVLIGALAIVFLLPCLDGRPGITPLEWAGVALWALALAGETAADRQLGQFRGRPENKGRICQSGWWNHSRHPNYFFEWLVWVGFFLFAWGAPWGCFTVLCPGVMLFFLLRVTGIPLTEEMSLKSKGEAYREYQRTTSAFVPWFKKTGSGE